VVQDAWSHRFDFAEFARRQNPLPDYRGEPTGFRWEASPMVRLSKGRRTLALGGLVHEGQYAPRLVSAVVLTREPLAVPERPAGEGSVLVASRPPSDDAKAARDVWERRPVSVGKGARALRPLWREWRKAFFADLVAGKVEGVEAGRFAGMAAYDEETNLVGTPAQIAGERAAMREFLAKVDRSHFKLKLEAEDFRPAVEGWWVEASSGASAGRQLCTGWWGGAAEAVGEGEVPTNGTYAVWVRYMEISGYLAKYSVAVEDADGKAVAERVLAADETYNREHGGFGWVKLVARLSGRFRVRLKKSEAGLTYRRVDAVLVTDDPAYVPEGEGLAIPPLDATRALTVWRPRDPWLGFSRVSYPLPGQDLSPYRFELREGEVESVLLLVRNNTEGVVDATPEVRGDWFGLVSWRVPGFVQSGWAGWQPMPLFRREDLLVQPGETQGVWLTVDGRRRFRSDEVDVRIGGETFTLDVVKRPALPAGTPVPYVFGWAAPSPAVSSWEFFRDIGVNVVSDGLVPKSEAEKYGIRLTVRLNDGDVSEGHVKYLAGRFARQGYGKADWAWSFMDEPGNATADAWTNLAAQVRRLDPEVRIWANPGEFENAGPEACMKITPYVSVYCPYCNHFQTDGGHNPAYNGQLRRGGPKFDLLLGYTTPCFGEKAPSAPLDHLGMCDFAIGCGLDGWAFFALQHGFTYSNSLWDEVNGYMGDQCVNVYPGAAYATISTRNAEAVREAVRRFRATKARPRQGGQGGTE